LTSCPKCGARLEIILDTDYTQAQASLAAKASGSDITNEQLSTLPWKQSQKKPALSTVHVNDAALAIPIAKLLYERLKTSANLSWKVGEITYKLSQNAQGVEWLQRWAPIP
jgi:hypothetical protein